MKGAVAVAVVSIGAAAAAIIVSAKTAPESAEDLAERPGLAWERSLPVRTGLSDASRIEPTLTQMASRIARRRVQVRCWSERDWEVVSAEWEKVTDQEHWWAAGFADTSSYRAHLAPQVCRPLALFTYGRYAPYGNTESYELAEALVVFAHEAEHLYDPKASEARVECLALQHVRGLVTRSGRSRAYANELAELAYHIAYPRLDSKYHSRHCRNGGRLDRNPDSAVWP
jgi:hypothetical protein